ncbi:hypothetical protein GGX14DRAFT_397044 [Mycena pura]|uniref:Uncharacterized protein n=1 Tax=Mycena pura TaxID=153505 RepID=A0AAD6Y9F6_9AGAR|nr:hypothetical protein GGX14DRAFT_400629 [Mycena pura]KAJ7206662.1 hypothetical protein GGX14DRAFT_397044 [Mycena pura]
MYVIAACHLTSAFPADTSFAFWVDVQNMPFHISLIRPRWYQDPTFAAEAIPAVGRTRELAPEEFRLPTRTIRSAFASNPIDNTSHDVTPPPRTQTVPARDVFHNVQAAIRPLIAGIQTREQVSDLIQSLEDLHRRNEEEARQDRIVDPPVISHKGRPRTNRLTNAREGRQRGGGARSSGRTQTDEQGTRFRSISKEIPGWGGLTNVPCSGKPGTTVLIAPSSCRLGYHYK